MKSAKEIKRVHGPETSGPACIGHAAATILEIYANDFFEDGEVVGEFEIALADQPVAFRKNEKVYATMSFGAVLEIEDDQPILKWRTKENGNFREIGSHRIAMGECGAIVAAKIAGFAMDRAGRLGIDHAVDRPVIYMQRTA